MILQLHIFYWSILWYSYDMFSCITITLFLLWLLQMVHVFRCKCYNFSNPSISFYNCFAFSIQVLLTELSLRDTPNRQTNRRPVTLHILPLSSGWLFCISTDQVYNDYNHVTFRWRNASYFPMLLKQKNNDTNFFKHESFT